MYAKRIDCPECGESLFSNARKCGCGWKNKKISESIPNEMIRCAHFDCNKKYDEVDRVNQKEFLCREHREDRILKNQNNPYFQIQAQTILLSRQYAKEAKELGISNREYCLKNCSSWGSWGGLVNKLISQDEKKSESSSRTAHLEMPESSKKLMKILDDRQNQKFVSDEEFFNGR